MPVDLGFVEKCDAWRLESRFFPSKVGGKPAWLNLKDIPGEKNLRCEYCQEPCIFLCQIYAPYEDNETAFHRTIYVFICKKPECCKLNENGNLKVFRSQLPRTNEFYSSEPPVEEPDWRTDININKWVKTCEGILRYKSEKEEIEKYENMLENGETGTFQNEDVQSELLSMANQKEDEIFAEFRLTVDKYPDQILRYDRGGKILYISGESKIDEVPKCLECNQERQFEFQIMPQLLNFLNLEDTLKCIDWGILTIFTCKNSCTSKNGYSAEYVWKQDIIETNSE
ncbi:zinc finger protein RP-8 isoform X2 [Augochlora pura]